MYLSATEVALSTWGAITNVELCLCCLRIHALVYLLTYLHSWLGSYKTGNISEGVEDKAKVITINGLYKVVHGLRLPPSMTLNDFCSIFKVTDSLSAAKMANYSLVMTQTPCIEFFAFGKR